MSLEQYNDIETVVAWTNLGHWLVTDMGIDQDGGHHWSPELVEGHLQEGEHITGHRPLEHEDHLPALGALAVEMVEKMCPSGVAKSGAHKALKAVMEMPMDKSTKRAVIVAITKAFLE